MDERERERNRSCLMMPIAKHIKISETLMTKPISHGKIIWESIPGRGNAVQHHKVGMGRQLLKPDSILWESSTCRIRPGGDGPEEGDRRKVMQGLLIQVERYFLKCLGSYWRFLHWGAGVIWLPLFKDHSGLWWHTFQYFPFMVLPLNI